MRAENEKLQGPYTLVMAEDDPEDRILAMKAFSDRRLRPDLRFVNNGSDLMDYLRGAGRYAENPPPRPKLILLDLNMPIKDGRETLAEIKSDPKLCKIPVIILTTSALESDVAQCYALGANSYIVKPASPADFGSALANLWAYWFETVRLPADGG